MTTRRHGTPSELFSLISSDEPLDDTSERTAEEAALHVVRVGRQRSADADRTSPGRGDGRAVAPHYRYDDEEPELDDPDRWQSDDDDETPDCEELLVIQHYVFDETGDGGDEP